MSNIKQKHKNQLLFYRRRMGYTQSQVSSLLGYRRTAMVSEYETGHTLPPLSVALKLGIVLRVPVEFLFGDLYDELRDEIRRKEEAGSAIQANETKS